ncbi:glycosyltransferase family 2 protein [Rhodanobacter sp. Si-c]|uniref:Glycosyltransferase family 2 protein n=1 Tax=Rhodanobacter lycopersici TaxID=3162487 RepID=A0ABV3QBS9_9GAMM
MTVDSKLLSVIIPAYNAAAYIGECIASILKQPECMENVNVIIVIDGATDNTLKVATTAIRGHTNIVRIITQKNAGPSTARNNGLDFVTTDYVTFLDADDIWLPDYLSTVLPLISECPDLIEYDAIITNREGHALGPLKIASAATGTTTTANPDDFAAIFQCYAWARVYRTSTVRSHPFPEGARFEDTATTPWHHWNSRKTISIGRALVGYRQHPTSILATPRPKDIEEIATAIVKAVAMYKQTRALYWQNISYRIFHFACQRITTQRIRNWPSGLRITKAAIADVSSPPGPLRWLQRQATPLYVTLLYFKRKLTVTRLF